MDEQNKGTGINWSRVLERNEHGAADLDATMRKLEDEARTYVATNEIGTDVIRTAVASVYAQFPKTSFDLGSLTNRVVTEMKVAAGSETKIGEAVKGFIRGESKSFEAGEGGLYHIARGKLGGVRRVTPEYTELFRKAQAKKAQANAQ